MTSRVKYPRPLSKERRNYETDLEYLIGRATLEDEEDTIIMGRELEGLIDDKSDITYGQLTTSPTTLNAATIKIGQNIRGIISPSGAVTVNIPTLSDPRMLVTITDEREIADQGEITVVAL